jgi:tRNA modification GTPase
MEQDTIVAIATAMNNSGIGIIRISGINAFRIIDKMYESKNNDKILSLEKSHTIHYGFIVDHDIVIDEVMVTILKEPQTYTRENIVEINCHGGNLVMRHILELVISNGARLAEPGEFTKRAFLNGRIDLSQAEAVMDIINAKNDYALQSSISQLKGALKNKIKSLREKIIFEIAFIESALDDPEHMVLDNYSEHLFIICEKLINDLNIILNHSENGELIKNGIKTAIIGKPNAGKSTLFNYFVGKERAIVTEIAGTTRDIIVEEINLDGITLSLMDTAGIRNTDDQIEQIGINKAKESMLNADLILYILDSSLPLDEEDNNVINMLEDKSVIVLLNKVDLPIVTSSKELPKYLENDIIYTSIKCNHGLEDLIDKIKEMFFHDKIAANSELLITNIRHRNALKKSLESIKMVVESINLGVPEDFYSIDLMDAYRELGTIIGDSIEDDLVNEIFSKFCTGK